MRIHQEFYLRSATLTPDEVCKQIERLTECGNDWTIPADIHKEYSSRSTAPSIVIHLKDPKLSSNIFFTVNKKGDVYITNVLHRKNSKLVIPEYNEIVTKFKLQFSKFVHENKVDISIRFPKSTIGLNEIITGKQTREFFENYLSSYPTSYHPLDIQRLDTFTCIQSRYSPDRLNLERLKNHLTSDLKWSEEDAEWCTSRIQTGLDVLRANRKC